MVYLKDTPQSATKLISISLLGNFPYLTRSHVFLGAPDHKCEDQDQTRQKPQTCQELPLEGAIEWTMIPILAYWGIMNMNTVPSFFRLVRE